MSQFLFASQSSNVWTAQLYPNAINKVNPYYVWFLTNLSSNATYSVFQTDSSPSPYFYSYFTMSLYISSATAGGLGSYNLSPGQYQYKVFETDVPYSINFSFSNNMVAIGLLNIIGTASPTPEYDSQYTITPPSFYPNMKQ